MIFHWNSSNIVLCKLKAMTHASLLFKIALSALDTYIMNFIVLPPLPSTQAVRKDLVFGHGEEKWLMTC